VAPVHNQRCGQVQFRHHYIDPCRSSSRHATVHACRAKGSLGCKSFVSSMMVKYHPSTNQSASKPIFAASRCTGPPTPPKFADSTPARGHSEKVRAMVLARATSQPRRLPNQAFAAAPSLTPEALPAVNAAVSRNWTVGNRSPAINFEGRSGPQRCSI